MPSAKATQASLPETIIIPFNKSSTETSSSTMMNIDEEFVLDSLQAFFDIKNFSSSDISPFFYKSNATIDVIIFVIEAGYIFISESFSKRILPDKESCKIAVLAAIFISAFNNELLIKIKKKNIFIIKVFIYLSLLYPNFQNQVHLSQYKYLSWI